MRQLGLFGEVGESESAKPTPIVEPLLREEDRELASRIPRFIRFGTSSWSFPGWSGIVYKETPRPSEVDLAKAGLTAYARQPLLRAVSLDRSYYGPLRAEDVRSYDAQIAGAHAKMAEETAAPELIPSFKVLSKVWDEITTAVFPRHPRYGERAGRKNNAFLSNERFEAEVLAPYVEAMTTAPSPQDASRYDWLGPFVFELTPMPQGAVDEHAFFAQVESFITRLPETRPDGTRWQWAFELRNQELFGKRWLDMLRAHRAAHVFTFWTAMPPLQMQLRAKAITAPFTITRLMLPPYTKYAARKATLAPFNAIAEPQEEMRNDVVDILRAASEAGCTDGYVLVNNKAEGSAPLTVREIAKKTATAFCR